MGARDGIAWHQVEEISSGLGSPLEAGVGPRWFAGVVLQYPGRHLAAIARTLGVFAGLGAREDELAAFTGSLMSPASRDSLMAPAAAPRPRYESLLLALCATPVVYALAHAVILMSIRRFMLPVYPLALAAATAGVWRPLAWLAHRVQRPIAAVHAPSARDT